MTTRSRVSLDDLPADAVVKTVPKEAIFAPEEVDAFFAEKKAAENLPTPPEVVEAFLPPTRMVAGRTLLPVVASTLTFLQKLNSPLMHHQTDEAGNITWDMSTEQLVEAFWVMTTPPPEVRRAFADGTHTARIEALQDILTPVHTVEVKRLMPVHYVAAFSTIIEHGMEGATPKPEAEPTAGSSL